MLYTFLRQKFIDWLIRLTEQELYNVPVKQLDEEKLQKFLVFLYDNPLFMMYCADRETRIVYAQAKAWTPEKNGQRAENAILFQKAKAAFEKNKRLLAQRANGSQRE